MIQDDVNKLYCEILEELHSNGKITGKRKELIFQTYTLTNLDKNVLFFPFAQRNWPWILRECSDRISNYENPGCSRSYSKNWANRLEESGLYSYHYSNRLKNQMKECLSKKKFARDKIVMVWQEGDYFIKGRQPCTIMMQPIMEYDNEMSLVVYMRNNDMVNIFPSDLFIHSTYFKYWCTVYNIEYKNLYWISAVAYYQKKRDEMKFVERLLDKWQDNYDNIKCSKWNKDYIEDFAYKENCEVWMIMNPDFEKIQESFTKFKTDYMREWYKIMVLANLKKNKMFKEFRIIKESEWKTEFGIIKNDIKNTR
jgi:hypothetical protein